MSSRELRVAALIGVLSFPALARAETSPVHDTARLSAEIDRQCAAGEFSGVIVVRAKGRELFSRACGDADIVNRAPNTRATRFKIYSTSKFLTALAVMRLVEQGRMKLDAPITEYLPDAPRAWSNVTIRALLNHTAGVQDLSERLVTKFRTDFPDAMAATLRDLPPDQAQLTTPAGAKWAYNNFGYELLAYAAGKAGGAPFPDLLKELVFVPAGMADASVQPVALFAQHPIDEPEDGLALGYNGAPGKLYQANNFAFIQMGSGGVRATVGDFVALDEALRAGRVIRPETYAEMTRAPVATTGKPGSALWGLGVAIRERPIGRTVGHTGGSNGYVSAFERFPAQDAMAVMLTNRGYVQSAPIFKLVAETFSDPTTAPPER